MTDQERKAIQLALEALEHWMQIDTVEDMHIFEMVTAPEAIAVLRTALERPEQKPVAYMGVDIEGNPNKFRLNYFGGAIPLYTKEQS